MVGSHYVLFLLPSDTSVEILKLGDNDGEWWKANFTCSTALPSIALTSASSTT